VKGRQAVGRVDRVPPPVLTIWLVNCMARRQLDHPPSRDRLLAAARHEFAARGYDGTKVDRIADRARVNKAMVYYHFRNKAALFREVLRELFSSVAVAVEKVRAAGGTPEAQLRGYIEAIAREGLARHDLSAMWLREIADGGRHVDASIGGELERVLSVLVGILDDGRRAGVFGPANPFVIHISIVAPLLFFSASAPARRRITEIGPDGIQPDPQVLVSHVQATALAVLSTAGPRGAHRAPASRMRT
jgi:TetR/AcrR family transcriptional regulator